MSSRKNALLITRSTLFAAARRRSLVTRCHAFEKGNILNATGGNILLRHMSSNVSSRYYEFENKGVVTNKKILSASQALNGIAKNKFDEQKEIDSPEVNNGTPANSSSQTPKEVEGQTFVTDTATKADVDAEDLQSSYTSPFELSFTGNTTIPVTSRLHIVTPEEDTPKGVWPIFRIMVSSVEY